MKKLLFVIWCLAFGVCPLYAEEITLLYTGETHGAIYHCDCPVEPDGGIARRATLVNNLRKENPNTLLLDSGAFFAGGIVDTNSQNTELDKARTGVHVKAMELMNYDAAAIGDDEFNFGREFLEETIEKTKVNFLSCNIKLEKISAYIIKEVAGLKVGIIGVSNPLKKGKTGGLDVLGPKTEVSSAVAGLKNKGADIIILLSHLGETDDTALINDVPGIDILISGHSRAKEEIYSKVGAVLVLRPAWQGRRLGKASLVIENKKIADFKVKEIRLSSEISDDHTILSILPECFSDANCRREGSTGACQDPGTNKSRCVFARAQEIPLTIIAPKVCKVCDTADVIKFLKNKLPGLSVSYSYYPGDKAKEMVDSLKIKGLPAYVFDKTIEGEKNFNELNKDLLNKEGGYYIVRPAFTGISYFLGRQKLKGKLDVFISLYDKNMAKVIRVIKDFKPDVHFLALEKNGEFEAAKGKPEVEEDMRSVCVYKYYPKIFYDYISCRAENIHSAWWEDCLAKGADREKISTCAKGPEGKALLLENIGLTKELRVMFGPAYLMDNQEVFGTSGVPSREELKKTLGRD
jgi:hypothetical protein